MNTPAELNKRDLIKKVLLRFLSALVVLIMILILPAGNLKYWHAWIYLCVLFIPMGFAFSYLIKNDPALLERRMRTKEKQSQQKKFAVVSLIFFFISFIIPGLDFRFSWSDVPVWTVLLSDIIILIGYLLFMRVMKENSYASRIVEIEQGQKVIESGPYAYIRHPMYTAVILIYIFSPLALGSWWAILFIIPIPVFIIYRIFNEEKLLKDDLQGYKEYTEKVRYRLLPYIW